MQIRIFNPHAPVEFSINLPSSILHNGTVYLSSLNLTESALINMFLILVTKKAFDPSGRNVYHKLCKEEGNHLDM